MKSVLQALRVGSALFGIVVIGCVPYIDAKPLEYNTPVCIRSEEFSRGLAVRRVKAADNKTAVMLEMVAVKDEDVLAKDGSSLVVFKDATRPDKTGPILFNDIFTIEVIKASSGEATDKEGFLAKRHLVWTFPGSSWNKEKEAVHFEPRINDRTEPKFKTDATHFAITSPVSKSGPVDQEDVVNIVSRAAGQASGRMMWVLNLDQKGVLPVLISSDDPWGKDPKSNLGGDRRIAAGKFKIAHINTTLLNDQGWQDLARVVQKSKGKQNSKATPGGQYVPGGQSFSYEPAIFGKGAGLYSQQWKAEKPGTLWIKVKAKAKSDVIVYVSAQPEWKDAAGTYAFFFGAFKNTRSQIRKGTQVMMEVDGAKPNSDPLLVAVDDKGNPKLSEFWINIEQHDDGSAELSAGSGSQVGEKIKMKWTDAQALKLVQYVGFGGWDVPVEYTTIEQSGNELGAKVPADFVQIPGSMSAVALSMQDGKVYLYGIDTKKQLCVWDQGSLNPKPWNIVELKDDKGAKITQVLDVAAGADGTVALVSTKRRVYFFDKTKGNWVAASNKLLANKNAGKGSKDKKVSIDRIVLGNADTVLGLDKKKKNIYGFVQSGWVLLSEGEGLDIAAGYDGSLYALNTKHALFSWEAEAWKRVETELAFSMISAATKDELYGIVVDEKNKRRAYVREKGGAWEAMQTADGSDAMGLKDIIALPTKPHFIIALDEKGNVYRKGEVAVQLNETIKKGVPVLPGVEKKSKAADKKAKKPKEAGTTPKASKPKKLLQQGLQIPVAGVPLIKVQPMPVVGIPVVKK